MPYCKNCHQKLTRLDKDICPYCGTPKPLEGISTETQDITTSFDPIQPEYKQVKAKSKVLTGILCIFFGILGVHGFYLQKFRLAFESILMSLLVIGGSFLVLYFTKLLSWELALIVPASVCELFFLVMGIGYIVKSDIKDGRGEFLR